MDKLVLFYIFNCCMFLYIAATWQIISAILAIAGLVIGILGVTLSVLSVVTKKVAGRPKVSLAIVVCNVVTCK